MQLKIRNFIAVFAVALAGMAAPLSSDTAAQNLPQATKSAANVEVSNRPVMLAVSYYPYNQMVYPNYGESEKDAPGEAKSADVKSDVSAVSEVDKWTMLVAILGLASMRLWCGGKKRLRVIS